MTGAEDRPSKGSEQDEASIDASVDSSLEPVGLSDVLTGLLAWVVPGAGHFLLGKRRRAVVFCGLIVACTVIGYQLEGKLDMFIANDPLSKIATLASAGSGAIYFALRFLVGYEGSIVAPGFEYGTTFLRTAGILNLLLVLDALDIARGRKS